MTASRVAAALSRSPTFRDLAPEQVEQLATHARLRSYRPHQFVFQADEPGDSLVVVESGQVKISVQSQDGTELVLTTVGAGGTIGELSIIDGGGRSADAEALEPTSAVLVEREAVVALMRAVPSFAEKIERAAAASLRRLTEWAADLVFLDIPRRVAKWLAGECERTGGTDITISQEELARRVGGTRQSVNGALREFERRGWVALANRRMSVQDATALARFADR